MANVKDEVHARVQDRMKELEPLVEEYEELRRIADAISGPGAPRAAPRRLLRESGPGRAGNSARAEQAQQLIEQRPGISVGELAEEMGIGTTYLYRLLPALERAGKLRKEGRGYFPAG